jgi:hypothetical protein
MTTIWNFIQSKLLVQLHSNNMGKWECPYLLMLFKLNLVIL